MSFVSTGVFTEFKRQTLRDSAFDKLRQIRKIYFIYEIGVLKVCAICVMNETNKCSETIQILLLKAAGHVTSCFIYQLTTMNVSPERDFRVSSADL